MLLYYILVDPGAVESNFVDELRRNSMAPLSRRLTTWQLRLGRISGGFREGPEGAMAPSVVGPYFFTSQLL